jgi:hypothetical protein
MRYRLWLVKLIAGSALLLFPPNLAFADELYGRIRGTVTDPSGAAMVGVQVTATNVATGVSKTVTSGADGSYEVIQLPAPATYNVSARQSGFKSFAATNIPLFLNQIYVLDIKMELGAFAQKVVIRAGGGTGGDEQHATWGRHHRVGCRRSAAQRPQLGATSADAARGNGSL